MKAQTLLFILPLALGACSYNASLLGSTSPSSMNLIEKPTSTTMSMYSEKPWYQDPTPSLTLFGSFDAQKVVIYHSADCSGAVWTEKNLSSPVTKYVDVVSPSLTTGTHYFSARLRLNETEQTECIVMKEPIVYSPPTGATSAQLSDGGEMMSLKPDGSVALWGDLRQVGDRMVAMPQLTSNVVRLDDTFPGALKSDGRLVYWGWMGPEDPNIDFSKEVVDFAGEDTEHAIVKASGDTWYWGDSNSYVETKVATNGKKVFYNSLAFALIKADGSVQAWGDPSYGGDTSAVASSLTANVVDIDYKFDSFVAIKSDGSVVAWGDPGYGGDVSGISSAVNTGVVSVVHSDGAYAALKSDGSVFAWGDANYGGDTAAVASSLASGVTKIIPVKYYGFVALKSNGSVVTWGTADLTIPGGMAAGLSSGVVQIAVSSRAIAALKSDGSVLSWGDPSQLDDWSLAQPKLASNTIDIIGSERQFYAVKANGSVVSWGSEGEIPQGSPIEDALSSGVSRILSDGNYSYTAFKDDGSTYTWNVSFSPVEDYPASERLSSKPVAYAVSEKAAVFILEDGSVKTQGYGGVTDFTGVETQLSSGVRKIAANEVAAVAIKADGSAVVWGGGMAADITAVASQLTSGVVSVASTERAFAVLKNDGSVVVWGEPASGGNPGGLAAQLTSGVMKIASTSRAFAALKSNGSVIVWGDTSYGANTTSVAAQISSGVVDVVGNVLDFAVIKNNGTVVTWGGGTSADSSSVAADLVNVVSIIGNTSFWGAFAALRSDGSVITWGDTFSGGDTSLMTAKISSGVTSIVPFRDGFAAVKDDDSAVIWSYPTSMPIEITDVESVTSGGLHLLIKRKDGAANTSAGLFFGEQYAQFMGAGIIMAVTVSDEFFMVREDGAMIGSIPQYRIEL